MKIASLSDFKSSLSGSEPPEELSFCGKALWWAGNGNWDKSHDLIQDGNDLSSVRIHAYLHRLEGDLSNAQYWYTKAGTFMQAIPLEKEWEDLVVPFILE